ncbi:hypothetical protein [Aquimarina longa]|uniref:hypothetical protein n=1 Tax=Aquimarina longa TaxID=1080221 RepID=UPI0007835CE6|nr:hypothetical protein [Aquimarina longa]
MLEILALAYFVKQIKKIALEKGIKPGKWIAVTVISWFVIEVIVFIIAFTAFDISRDEILMALIPALLLSATSAYFILERLKKQVPIEA